MTCRKNIGGTVFLAIAFFSVLVLAGCEADNQDNQRHFDGDGDVDIASLSDDHLYTVDEVLAEYLTFYSASRPHVREDAVQTVRNVLADPTMTVIPQSHASFLDGLTFYAARLDKQYSLTDCVATQAMRREGLTDVLTNDHHFTQEGFHILFP